MSAGVLTRAASVAARVCLGAALSAPAVAAACTVCYDPKEAGKGDFLEMTVFMSLLPLAMMGGVALFVWSRFRSRDSALVPAPVPVDRPR